MNELDPDAKALFDAARDALGPPAGAEARIFSKLGAAAGVSVATLAAATSAASKPATLLAKLSGVVLQLLPTTHALPIAVVAFGGTAVGVWSYAHIEPAVHVAAPTATVTAHSAKRTPRPALASKVATPMSGPSAVPEASSAPPALDAAPVVVGSAAPAAVGTPRVAAVAVPRERVAPLAFAAPEPPPAPPAPRDAQAEAELLLIREMQAAWRSGNDAQLSAAVAEHRTRFPSGMLSEEREALSAMLACRQVPGQASIMRARFAARYARSAYEARVNAACLAPTKEEQ